MEEILISIFNYIIVWCIGTWLSYLLYILIVDVKFNWLDFILHPITTIMFILGK